MDSRLHGNIEAQLRPEDTWDQRVSVAESYEANMYSTGGCRGSDRSHAANSKPHTQKKENTYHKHCTPSAPRNTGKGKALAKKRTYTKSNKPSKVQIARRKGEGACF